MVLARTVGTVADGCGRLRTVANSCDRERNVERTHPQPPDPQSETGTLATHSGIKHENENIQINYKKNLGSVPGFGQYIVI